MWLLIGRTPAPDAPFWPGRRWLATIDAVAWPVALALALQTASEPLGVVGPLFIAVALLVVTRRVYRAIFANHRYRFTTWRWGRVMGAFLIVGWMFKILIT